MAHERPTTAEEEYLEGRVTATDGELVLMESAGRTAAFTPSVAETVSVPAGPSRPPRTALPEQLGPGRERYGR